MNIDDMKKMIEEADDNGDNELQKDEFIKFMCYSGKQEQKPRNSSKEPVIRRAATVAVM